jgi:hypothetical protein
MYLELNYTRICKIFYSTETSIFSSRSQNLPASTSETTSPDHTSYSPSTTSPDSPIHTLKNPLGSCRISYIVKRIKQPRLLRRSIDLPGRGKDPICYYVVVGVADPFDDFRRAEIHSFGWIQAERVIAFGGRGGHQTRADRLPVDFDDGDIGGRKFSVQVWYGTEERVINDLNALQKLGVVLTCDGSGREAFLMYGVMRAHVLEENCATVLKSSVLATEGKSVKGLNQFGIALYYECFIFSELLGIWD